MKGLTLHECFFVGVNFQEGSVPEKFFLSLQGECFYSVIKEILLHDVQLFSITIYLKYMQKKVETQELNKNFSKTC